MRISRSLSAPLSAAALIEHLMGAAPLSAPAQAWRPRLQLSETDRGVIARLELAGFSKDQIDISVEKDRVTVSAKEQPQEDSSEAGLEGSQERVVYTEFQSRAFTRSFSVGFDIDSRGASAKMEDGVLAIELPKSETALRKTLAIE